MFDVLGLLEELVGIESVNPAMGGGGEGRIASFLSGVLADLGLNVATYEVFPGRPNVVGVLPGSLETTVLLEAHLDTVAMPEGGLTVRIESGRLTGRGSCDTKGSCAAMVGALALLAERGAERPTVMLAGAVDEEVAMAGSRALLEQLPRVDAAVIGEPTSLVPVRVHNGLARFRIVARGRSAHSSRAHLGINAISAAARAVTALDRLTPRLHARAHPLTGPALLMAGVIDGGVAPNVVPDRCEILCDRRLAPGERAEDALDEIDDVLRELKETGAEIVREDPSILLPAVETRAEHPLVRAAESAAATVLGRHEPAGGAPYGTDGSNLAGLGGIPCVVLGPGSIDQAHSQDEWVRMEEVEQAARIYAELASNFANGRNEGGIGSSERSR